jgi:hypothetical protein
MKIAYVLAAAALVVMLFLWQRPDFKGRLNDDAKTIAALKAQVESLENENRTLRVATQKQTATRSALTSAGPIAARYRNAATTKR